MTTIAEEGMRSVTRRLWRGGGWALLARLSTFPVGFALAWLLARLLSPQDLGGYFLATSLVGLGAALAQFGLGRAMVKLIAANLAIDRPRAVRKAIRVGLLTTALLASLAAGLLADGPGQWLIALLRGGEVLQDALPWIALLVIGYAATDFMAEVLRGFHDLRAASALADFLLQRFILMALLTAIWAMAWQPTLAQVIMLAFLATLVSTAVGIALVRRHLVSLGGGGPSVPWRDVLMTGPPFLLVRLNLWLLVDAGVWFLGIYRPPEEVGVYGAASLLGMLVLGPLFVVNAVQAPMIAELYSTGRIATLEKALRGAAAIGLLPALLLALALIGGGELVLGLLFGPHYAQGHVVLAILAIGRLVSVACGSGALVLIMTNHHRDVILTSAAVALVTVAGYLLLAPALAAEGVALVAAAAIALQAAALAALARKRVGIAIWPQLSTGALAILRASARSRRGAGPSS